MKKDGHWITTKSGKHIFIQDGKIYKKSEPKVASVSKRKNHIDHDFEIREQQIKANQNYNAVKQGMFNNAPEEPKNQSEKKEDKNVPNTKSVRKVLNEAGLPGVGKRLVPLMNNKIQYASTSEKTGMLVSEFGNSIRVFAETRHPVEDIEKAAKALRDKGYDVEVNGSTAYVNKTPPKETQKSSEDYIKEWKENEKKDVVDELEKYYQRVQEIKDLPIMERTALERNIPSSYLNVVKHNFKDEDARKRSFDRYATQLVDSHFEALKDKVEKNIGPITDIRRTGGPNDYVLTGESGKSVSIQVVRAGGYNKQRLHTRWVQNKLGPRDKKEETVEPKKEENTLSRIKKETKERAQEKYGNQKWIERDESGEIIYKGVVKNVDTGEKKVMEFTGSSRKHALEQLKKNGYSLESQRVLPRKLYDEVIHNSNANTWDFDEASEAYQNELKAEKRQKNNDVEEEKSDSPTKTNKYGFEVQNSNSPSVEFSKGTWEKMKNLREIGYNALYDNDMRDAVDEKISELVKEYGDLELYDPDLTSLRSRLDSENITDDELWAGYHTMANMLGIKQNRYTVLDENEFPWDNQFVSYEEAREFGANRDAKYIYDKWTQKMEKLDDSQDDFDLKEKQMEASRSQAETASHQNNRDTTVSQSSSNDSNDDVISKYASKLNQASNKASYLAWLVRSGKITESQKEILRQTYKRPKK